MQEKPSAYTPSNTSEELLEKMFVQRHKLLEKSVKWTEQSILTEKKNHLIYIGPRGSGKTHFVTMLVNRIKKQAKLQKKMTLIWLGEDETITSFLDFAITILQTMVEQYPQQYHNKCLQEISKLDTDAKATHILSSITQQLDGKTLVIIKENINLVFKGLGEDGQHSLRSFLQEKNNTVLLCTSQLLFNAITTRKAPFFGFFDTYHLKPLNLKQATELITKLAKHEDNNELVEFLQTPLGKFRMRALHYLAGGNHRLYIKLVKFLTKESLDDLVKALMDLAEELTPYFQERINSLSGQQQKIIQHLCKIAGAIPVKDLAEQMIVIEQRSLAKQLGELKKINYVISHKRGKQSFYEIAEPLMRFSQEVKNSHGKPLKLVASLLRAWFSDEELQERDNSQDKQLNDYKTAALKASKKILHDINSQILQEADTDYRTGNKQLTIKKLSQIIISPITKDTTTQNNKAEALYKRGVTYGQEGETNMEIADYTQLIELESAPIEYVAQALYNRGFVYREQGESDKAIADYTKVIELENPPVELVANALNNRAVTYGQQGELNKKIEDYTQLIELENSPVELVENAINNRGVTYGQQGKLDMEINDYTKLIDLKNTPVDKIANALYNRGVTYRQQGELDKAITDYTQLIELENAPVEQIANAFINRGVIYEKQGLLDKAITDYTQLIELENSPVEQISNALINRGVIYEKQGLLDKAIANCKTIINLEEVTNKLANGAIFIIPEYYYLLLNRDKARLNLENAFKKGYPSEENYPSNIKDILIAIINLGSKHWQDEIIWMIKLFAKYKALDFLGVGLIKSISVFIKDKSLSSSLEKWDKLWQKNASSFDEMQISIQALNLSRLAIEQKSDKPLFALPKEIRDLVLEVLGDALEVEN